MSKASIAIDDWSPIYYGQPIQAVDYRNFSIEANVADDYGEATTTLCTRTSPDGVNDTCGNCTALTCQFIVTDAVPGEVITVAITIDTVQGGSSINFLVYAKGMFKNGYFTDGIISYLYLLIPFVKNGRVHCYDK